MTIPQSEISWAPCFRIIADRYPPINFFDSLSAYPADWEILVEVAQMTDPQLKVGDLSRLEPEDRLSGPGSGRILPSFTFRDPLGTRFSTTNFGAFYAANTFLTAVFETVHHRTAFMLATGEPAQDLDQLLILVDLKGNLDDIRQLQNDLPEVYNPTDYSHSQSLALTLRQSGSLGIVYRSVRHQDGECAAIWRARVLSNARETRRITYRWDGSKISGYYDKADYQSL